MFKKILLPVDLNDKSSWEKALPTAIELCRLHGAALYVMTVVPDIVKGHVAQYFPEGYEQQLLQRIEADLTKLVQEQTPNDIPIQDIVAEGTIYHEILAVADKIEADLIVMASHRPELSDYLIGPNAARVVRHSKHSVLVLRN